MLALAVAAAFASVLLAQDQDRQGERATATLQVFEARQFEPVTWTCTLALAAPQPARRVDGPWLQVQARIGDDWGGLGDLPPDPVRRQQPRSTSGIMICPSGGRPYLPLELTPQQPLQTIQELREPWVLGWVGVYRARCRWQESVGERGVIADVTSPWVEFEVMPHGPDGDALAVARRQPDELWATWIEWTQQTWVEQALWLDVQRTMPMQPLPNFPLFDDIRRRAFENPVRYGPKLPMRVQRDVAARLVGIEILETLLAERDARARRQLDAARAEAVADALDAARSRLEDLLMTTTADPRDQVVRLGLRLLQIRCWRGLGHHDQADEAIAALRVGRAAQAIRFAQRRDWPWHGAMTVAAALTPAAPARTGHGGPGGPGNERSPLLQR